MRRASPFLAAISVCSLAACGDPSPQASSPSEEPSVPVLGSLPAFSLTDQTGAAFGMEALSGHVWVADFIFTRCPDMCPMLTAEMARLQRDLHDTPALGDVRLLSISVDPEHDSPPVLAAYAERNQARPGRWSFLTGPRTAIASLATQGFRLPMGDPPDHAGGPILHSDKFVIVDRQARIRGYYSALEADDQEALRRDLQLVASEAPPIASAPAAVPRSARELELPVPPDAESPDWLASRGALQLQGASEIRAYHDFQFSDRLPESGITFVHRTTADSAEDYKAVHYDHGTGLAMADVDADGRLDLYFTTQLGSNELWRNLGGGRFEEVPFAGGAPVLDRISVGASFGDTDNDGDPDLFVTTVRGGNLLFENDGTGSFRNISAESGLQYSGHSSSAVFFDYNRDGLLDLFVANVGVYTTESKGPGNYYVGFDDAFSGHLKPERSERSLLYENRGGNRFVDVSEAVGLEDERWSGSATPVDFNTDGWPDLSVLNMQGLDGYYENVEGKRFVAKTEEVFPRSSWGAMGVKSFDFDNDGDFDLFVTDMHSDMGDPIGPELEKEKSEPPAPPSFLRDEGRGIYGNSFFRNDGGGRFQEVSDAIGAENYWPWGLSVGDLNADGYEDVFIASSMNYPYRYGVNSILLNEAGKRFADAEFILGAEPRRHPSTTIDWFELDCAEADRYHKHCEGRTGRVVVKGARGSRSSAIFDLDDDGDLDIVASDFRSEPVVLVSDLSERRAIRFLKIRLVGTRSNRDGLGARVELEAGSRKLTQVHDGQSGYLSQSLAPLYFGLGDETRVDRIRVRWPSGRVQELEGPIETNRTLELREAS